MMTAVIGFLFYALTLHILTVALRKSELPFLFAFAMMPVQLGGRYIEGCANE